MSLIINIKEAAIGCLFLVLLSIPANQSHAQTGGCTASFTYDMTDCPNIHFTSTSTADTTIGCLMFNYYGQGSIDHCTVSDNKFSTNGTYIVCIEIMTMDGCADSYCDTIIIDCICDKPEASFEETETSPMNFQFNDSTDFHYSGATWDWDFGDGNISNAQHPTHVYSAPGTYQVCLAVQDSCSTNATCKWVEVADTSSAMMVAEISNQFNIYPNPITGSTLTLSGFGSNPDVFVYDAIGSLVKRYLKLESSTLDIGNLPAGTYELRIVSGSQVQTKLLIRR
jgi:hypothetical protein